MYEKKIESMILGLAIGDALGVPYEFQGRDEIRSRGEIIMRGYGSHQQPEGSWSDDTSLTLCLLESLGQGRLDYI